MSPGPISRLPAELLLEVFAHVPRRLETRSSNQDIDFESDRLWRVQDLCPLTAVCRTWRKLALASPSLWSTVISHEATHRRPRIASHEHYIHRCTVGPIYVALSEVEEKSPVWKTLAEVRERVHELYVEGPFSVDEKLLLPPEFPNLERCAWIGSYAGTREPDPLRFCGTPRLRTLELHRPPCIPSSSYPALTELTIIGPCPRGDFGHLLRLLSATPRLQVLVLGQVEGLCYIGPPDRDGDKEQMCTQKAHLPLLRRLELKERHATVARHEHVQAFLQAVLYSLTFPPSCKVHFHRITPDALLNYGRQLPHIRAATRLGIAWQRSPTDVSYSSSGSTTGVALSFSTEDGSVQVSFLASCAARDDELLLALRAAVSAPECTSICKVSLGAPFSWLCGPLILRAFPRLTLLRIATESGGQDTMENLSQHLARQLQPLQIDDAGPPACPLLTRLWVDWPRMLCWDDATGYPTFRYDEPPEPVMDLLREFAHERAAEGYPLSRVFVSHPLPPSSYDQLVSQKFGYTVDEYDGSVEHVLRSRMLELDGQDGGPLEELFRQEWDRVEGVGI